MGREANAITRYLLGYEKRNPSRPSRGQFETIFVEKTIKSGVDSECLLTKPHLPKCLSEFEQFEDSVRVAVMDCLCDILESGRREHQLNTLQFIVCCMSDTRSARG